MGFSIWQLLIVLVIIVLIFGTKKLKNLGGDLGGALKNFKDAVKDEEKQSEKPTESLDQKDADFTNADAKKSEENPKNQS